MPKRSVISPDDQNRITAAMQIMKSKKWDIDKELKAHDVHDMLKAILVITMKLRT